MHDSRMQPRLQAGRARQPPPLPLQRTLPVCQFPLPAIHSILRQVVLFTAGLEDYAAPICDAIEARYPGAFHHRLYRPATVACEAYPCVKVGGQAAILQKPEQLAPGSCTATDQMPTGAV